MKTNQPIAATEGKDKNPEDKTASANFRFGKDSDKPKLSNVAMDTEVTITLKGKITSFEHDPDSNWNKDTRFGLTLTSCTVEKDGEINSMADAIENANGNRRKV